MRKLEDNLIVIYFFNTVLADMFLQHLDLELTEEDVQKITSGCKQKTQIAVKTPHLEIIKQIFL